MAGKRKKIEIDQKYVDEAARLAKDYSRMVKMKQFQDELRAGKVLYTREDAIADLIGGGINYGSEHVQSSNLSNVPERVAIKLSEGYAEKKNAQMVREATMSEIEYALLTEEIDIVRCAGKRMDPMDRMIFSGLYIKGMTYSRIIEVFEKKYHRILCNKSICRAKERALSAIAEEYMLRSVFGEEK